MAGINLALSWSASQLGEDELPGADREVLDLRRGYQ